MRFIFYTDLHLRGSNPGKRIDDFPTAILNKLKEVYDISAKEKVDFVIFGGDFFDAHIIQNQRIIREAARIIKSSNIKTYQIIGQHDLLGYNFNTSYEDSSLGLIDEFCSDIVTIKDFISFDGVDIYACHVFDDLKEKYTQSLNKKKKNILIAHKLIYNKTMPYEVYSTKDIKTDFDMILSGDLHCGFETHKEGKTIFSNPGSLSRLTILDKDRIPSVLLVNSENLEINTINLKNIGESEKIFDVRILEEIKKEENMGEKIKNIFDFEIESCDIFEIILKIGEKEGINEEVLAYIKSKRVVV